MAQDIIDLAVVDVSSYHSPKAVAVEMARRYTDAGVRIWLADQTLNWYPDGHCCVGRKWDTTSAPREALRVGKHATGVYSTPDKSLIWRLGATRKVPRRRNATVPVTTMVALRPNDVELGDLESYLAFHAARLTDRIVDARAAVKGELG